MCVCLATCRDGNYCDRMGPQRDTMLQFILSLSLKHVFSSSHNRVRSHLCTLFILFIYFVLTTFLLLISLSLTAELNELVSCRVREWSRLACTSLASIAETKLKSTTDMLSVNGITSQRSILEKYQKNLTGAS